MLAYSRLEIAQTDVTLAWAGRLLGDFGASAPLDCGESECPTYGDNLKQKGDGKKDFCTQRSSERPRRRERGESRRHPFQMRLRQGVVLLGPGTGAWDETFLDLPKNLEPLLCRGPALLG